MPPREAKRHYRPPLGMQGGARGLGGKTAKSGLQTTSDVSTSGDRGMPEWAVSQAWLPSGTDVHFRGTDARALAAGAARGYRAPPER